MKKHDIDNFHHLQAVTHEGSLLAEFLASRKYIREKQKVDVMLMYIASMLFDESITEEDIKKIPEQIAYYHNVFVDAHEEIEEEDCEECRCPCKKSDQDKEASAILQEIGKMLEDLLKK